MKVAILAVGRMKSGPERDLYDAYSGRFSKIGAGLGLKGLTETEVDAGGGLEAEGRRILSKVQSGARCVRLDEGGRSLSSTAFAEDLAKRRDSGEPSLVFVIGGAEGFSDEARRAIPETMAFGRQTWPHRLVRAMLAEQLYRAASILAGAPYHKA